VDLNDESRGERTLSNVADMGWMDFQSGELSVRMAEKLVD
jgi:hypothetical protein